MATERAGASAGLVALRLVLEEEHYRALAAEDLLGCYLSDRDERAFAALVRRYGRLVMARCRDVLRREDLAQEAFQETFTQLVLNGHSVRRRGAVGRWLARTARRRSLNIARRERRQRARDLTSPPRIVTPDPAVAANESDARAVLARAMGSLPEHFRLPIELVYLDGMTHAEAANAIGCSKGTVDSWVRRGLEKLKRALGPSELPLVAAGMIALIPQAEAVSPECIQRAMQSATAVPIPPPPGPVALLAERLTSAPVIAVVAVIGVAVAIGWAQWPEPKPKQAPGEPFPPVTVESLPQQNLRLLQAEIAPKFCDALKGLTDDGNPPSIIEMEAYDSRARILIKGSYRKRLPGVVGESSRAMFYFDTGRRKTYMYMDHQNNDNWKPIDPEKPVTLAKFPKLKVEWTMKIPELTKAIKAFDDFPRDPRAEAEVAKRRAALREEMNRFVGIWYLEGDRKKEGHVDLIEPLGLAFFEPGAKEPTRVVTEEEVWACEARSRAWPIYAGGMLGCIGIVIDDDGQTMRYNQVAGYWKRAPAKHPEEKR